MGDLGTAVTHSTLRSLIAQLNEVDDDLVIYARRPFGPTSAAVLADDGATGVEEGFEYLLEVWQAVEAVEVWTQWRRGRRPTPEEATNAVLHYGTHDAFLPTEEPESDA